MSEPISTIEINGVLYEIVDSTARSMGREYVLCSDASNTPSGVSFTSGATTITGTLTAANANKTGIYLVKQGATSYAEYIVVKTGTTSYAWERLGFTDITITLNKTTGTFVSSVSKTKKHLSQDSVNEPTGVGDLSTATRYAFTESVSNVGYGFSVSNGKLTISLKNASGDGKVITEQGTIKKFTGTQSKTFATGAVADSGGGAEVVTEVSSSTASALTDVTATTSGNDTN